MLRYIAANANQADAVVVGEYERAFLDGAQVRELWAVLERYGVQLWLPEAGGPVDFANPEHEALFPLLAVRSQTEVSRSRHRVVTALRMQTVEQGRHLGAGRPTATSSSTRGCIRIGRWRGAGCAGSGLCRTRPRHPS